MNVLEAKELLDACTREELQDHAFGDSEVFWIKNYVQIADGQFSGEHANVWFKSTGGASIADFNGDDARILRLCGTEGVVYREDTTGPDEYVEGRVMPGLTKQGVLEELTDSRYHDLACDCDSCLGKDQI